MTWFTRCSKMLLQLTVAVAVVAAWGAASRARADDPEGRVWLWFRPGYMYTDLDAANRLIDAGNVRFAARDLTTLDTFHNTFFIGADLHIDIHRRVTLYGGVGSIFGSEKKAFNRVVETKISGTPVTGGVLYRVPWIRSWEESLDDLDLFVGGGVVFMSNFEFSGSDEDLTTGREFLEERVFSGDGLGFEARASLEYFLAPKFTLVFGAAYRALSMSDLTHTVRVDNPNAFNLDGDDDGDGITNQFDPDYRGTMNTGGNTQRMYGRFESNSESPGSDVWVRPDDRYLESLYRFDARSYEGAPDDIQVYDPNAQFDIDLGGFQAQLGLSYYIF